MGLCGMLAAALGEAPIILTDYDPQVLMLTCIANTLCPALI